MTEVEPSAKSTETIPLSGSDPVEDAQEGWAAIRPPALWLDFPEQSDSWADVMRNNWPLDSGDEILSDENESDVAERRRWQQWAKHAAEHERQRRIKVGLCARNMSYAGICFLHGFGRMRCTPNLGL